MSNYQSFPGKPGDSESLQKLKSLQLPDIRGKSVLDLGCNAGFFSGFAFFSGASKVVGIDSYKSFVDEAKSRFPECTFLEANFEDLPPARYDVVLILSAIHYAKDQESVIHSIMKNHLKRDGILILEIGIVDDGECQPKWHEIDRGIDKRFFPNWHMIDKILSPYAYKMVAKSANQKGDPTPRFVIHVINKRRYSILLSSPSGSGKTTIARSIFNTKTSVVSLDLLLTQIQEKKIVCSELLYHVVKYKFSKLNLIHAYEKIGQLGLYEEFMQLAINENTNNHLAIDGYIPPQYIETVKNFLTQANFFVLEVGTSNCAIQDNNHALQAEIYYESLRTPIPIVFSPKGFIDKFEKLKDGGYLIKGWAINEHGFIPENLSIKLNENNIEIRGLNVTSRPDVQHHLNSPHHMIGFTLTTAPLMIKERKKLYSETLNSPEKMLKLLIGETLLTSKLIIP